MEYDFYKIGERIVSERKRHGLSQEMLIAELSDMDISVGRNTLSALEGGTLGKNTSLKLLSGLCKVFKCEMGYLLCEEGYENCHTRQRSDVQAVTGLNEAAIHQLEMLKENSVKMPIAKQMLDTLNTILSDPDCMADLLEAVGGYIGTCTYNDAASGVPDLSDLGLNTETHHLMRVAAACGNLKHYANKK